MDEATGQATTAAAKRSRKRRRNDAETVEHVTVEKEREVVQEETPAKKVKRCYINIHVRVHVYHPIATCIYIAKDYMYMYVSFIFQSKKWKNKQRVLVFCARGITYR